jgi:hypothetical protein
VSILLFFVFLVVGLGFSVAAWATYREEASYPHKELHIAACVIGAVFFLFLTCIVVL